MRGGRLPKHRNLVDSRRFPQQGKTLQAGRLKLNMDCTGSDSPTVILEQGAGMPALGWMKVQPQVAQFTRVCSYDRAGYGWSEPGPMPRTVPRMANELKALLDASGEKGPYVMAADCLDTRLAGRTGPPFDARKTAHRSGQQSRHHVRAPRHHCFRNSRGLVGSPRSSLNDPRG